MQIVYITNRPAILAETLGHVSFHMPWIDAALVVAPRNQLERLRLDTDLSVTTASDEDVIGAGADELANIDHVSRNIRIRKGILKHGLADEVFLLSDDDYRPLKAVSPEFFIEDDRFHGYYSYDLAAWRWSDTDFDRAQHVTYQALLYLGCSHLSFGAHMPQIMDRAILAEAFEAASRLTDADTLCEWSLYFNFGQTFHPERFWPARPFCTLGWPEYPGSWPFWVRPGSYAFENFYPGLYEPGHLFAGLATAHDPVRWEKTNFEKINRSYELELAVARLDFRGTPTEPWTRHSPVRKAAFSVLRRARRAVDYLTLEERARLSELAGDVDRLRREIERDDPGGNRRS